MRMHVARLAWYSLTTLLAAVPTQGGEPTSAQAQAQAEAQPPAKEAPKPNPQADPDQPEVAPRAVDSDSPLAEGWPGATKPGTIEVKSYPAYRSAVARAKDAPLAADNVLFWPLVNHISNRGIAMTTPVVNTYTLAQVETPDARGDLSMEFVYRTRTTGEAGKGVGAVKVENHPAATYVCFGIQGRMSAGRLKSGVARLKTWLDEHESEWVEAGPPRRLGYHGPMIPTAQRLWEVRVPVKPAQRGSK
jgi:hypothetical protein